MSTGTDWANDVGGELPTSDDGFGFSGGEFGFDDMDVTGVDAKEVGSGHLKVDKKGWYQFRIEATAKPKPYEENDMSKPRKPSISLRMVVVASDNGTPPGAIHYHDLILGGKGAGVAVDKWDMERTLNFLVGCGVLRKEGDKVIDPETGTTKIRSSTLEKRLSGLNVIGKIELTPARTDEKSGKTYSERIEFPFGRGLFHPAAKEVAHHKWVNDEVLKAAGIVRGAAKPNA